MWSRKFLMMLLIPWFFCTQFGCEYDETDDGSQFDDGEQFGSRAGSAKSGLVGAYFNNKDLTSQALERVDTTINFDWAKGSPNSKIETDTFSVRWTGFVESKYSQTYTLYTVGDDGIRLWVDNKLVVNDWSNHGARERSGTIALQAGKKYPIKLEYYEDGGGAVAKLLWSSPSQGKQVIPKEQLFTSDVVDQCPNDPNKINPGQCGCGIPEGSCGNDANVARGKSTRQSSTANGGVSSRAADGNTSGNWSDNSITHTEYTAAPWWIVDLGASYRVTGVTLWNRTNCCSERLSNFHVDYLGQTGNVVATKNYPGTVGAMANIDLAASGVYSVRVQLNGTNYLSLAEVEVWGSIGSSGTGLCAEAAENQSASLSCQSGKTINSITFASYGLPTGSCDTGFQTSTCHASSSKSKVEASCLHKQSCAVAASNGIFGDPCSGKFKKIAIVYTCSGNTIQCTDTLVADDRLLPGEHICSENGKYEFGLTPGGELALWSSLGKHWSAGAFGSGVHLIMQGDGNLVVYKGTQAPWASNTHGNPGATLKLENDGRVVIRLGSEELWSQGGDTNVDQCPNDPNKTEPGQCGCGVPEGSCGGKVDASTLNNKIMAGYQGWFMASGDGSGMNWRHWASSTPNASNINFEMWPDLREYDADELYATSFKYSNGRNAGLYSAYTQKTVERHVKWMRDYGIDGVFVQRFIGEAKSRTSVRDRVLNNIRIGSEKYGRVFANMYDISGGNASTWATDVKNDWMHLVDDQKVTQSDRYLRHNGRPVLAIWGFGFGDRPGNPTQAADLIKWLTETAPAKYRVTIMGGVDPNWRGQSDWLNVYRSLDILSPWAVGRFGDDSGADSWRRNKIEPDLAECKLRNIDYLPVVFPGFSWWNLKDGTSPFNKIPRRGGRFFWRQAYNAIAAGSNMVYVAMFDEVDEGTAMFKIAENSSQTPTTGKFLTLDADGEALPSDWYLKLMGEATRMLRKERSLTPAIPIKP